MNEDLKSESDDKSAAIQFPGPRCTFVLASSTMGAAATFAARANLAIREWVWLPSDGELRVFRLVDDAAELGAIAPLRSFEVRHREVP